MISLRSVLSGAAGALLLLPSAAHAQTADEIVARHLAAIGGKTAFDRIKDKVETWSITLDGFDATAKGTLTVKTRRPDRIIHQIELDLPGQLIRRAKGFDGKSGWERNQGLISPILGEELVEFQNLAWRANNGELHRAAESGTRIELVDKRDFKGRKVFVLELTPKKGRKITYFLDAETYMIRRFFGKTIEMGMNVEVDAYPTSYRRVDGIRVADEMEVTNSIPDLGTEVRYKLKLRDVKLNSGLEDSIFSDAAGEGATPKPEKKTGWY